MNDFGYYILGAGGFGRELRSWLLQTPPWSSAVFRGFLDDSFGKENLVGAGLVGPIDGHRVQLEASYFCAIGDPKLRLQLGKRLRSLGARFPVLRHPSSIVGQDCLIGDGCIFCPGAVVTANVTLGDFVLMNLHATVGHDVRIGDGCTLSCHSDVTGYAVLEEGVFLGSHASVLPRAKVRAYAKVGAGTVVLRSVNAGATVMGVPAKQILP